MVDNYGFQPLDSTQAPPGKHNDYGFVPLPSETNTASPVNDQPTPSLGTIPAAIVGGLSTGGANVGESVIDAGTWALNKLGIIAPNTKKQIDNYIAQGANSFKVNANPKGDVFERAAAEHPYLSGAASLGVEVPALLSTPTPQLATAGEGAGLGSKLLAGSINQLGQMAVNAPIASGMSGPGQQYQDQAALASAIATPVFNAVGKGISYLANKQLLPQKIVQKVMNPINSSLLNDGSMSIQDKAANSISNMYEQANKINDNVWDAIKQIPGTIDTYPLKGQMNKLLDQANIINNGGKLDVSQSLLANQPKVLNTILNVQNAIPKIQTMDDALKLKQMLSQGYNKINGNVTNDIYDLYKGMVTHIDDAIKSKAADAGLSSDYNLAKNYWKQVMIPLNNQGAPDIAAATANKVNDMGTYSNAIKGFFRAINSPQDLLAKMQTMDSNGSQIMEQKFLSDTFNNLVHSPEALDPNKALFKVNQFKTTYGKVMSADSNATIDGVKKLLESAGAVSGKKSDYAASSLSQRILGLEGGSMVGGALLGGAAGSYYGGDNSAVGMGLGGFAGMVGGPIAAQGVGHFINKLLNSPTGVKLLQGIGEGKPWTKSIGKVLSIGIPSEFSKGND